MIHNRNIFFGANSISIIVIELACPSFSIAKVDRSTVYEKPQLRKDSIMVIGFGYNKGGQPIEINDNRPLLRISKRRLNFHDVTLVDIPYIA